MIVHQDGPEKIPTVTVNGAELLPAYFAMRYVADEMKVDIDKGILEEVPQDLVASIDEIGTKLQLDDARRIDAPEVGVNIVLPVSPDTETTVDAGYLRIGLESILPTIKPLTRERRLVNRMARTLVDAGVDS